MVKAAVNAARYTSIYNIQLWLCYYEFFDFPLSLGLRCRLFIKLLPKVRCTVPGVTAMTRQSNGLPTALPGPGELWGEERGPAQPPLTQAER